METILTGIRPTGNLHLGHLFGAAQNWLELQDQEQYKFHLEIADVQALTDNFNNPEKLKQNIFELTTDLLSIGINPKKVHIFLQSKIPEIAELTIFYSNLVTMARLYRNPTVKNEISQKKAIFGQNGESVTYGFVGYPVSQAADITIFKGDKIPVGEDQLPLIEQCREIVRKFNSIYGETFQEPQPLLSKTPRVKGLDGQEKMGKSLGNAIFLKDTKEEITKKIMGTVTDSEKIKKDDPANPDICMVYYYHQLIKNEHLKTVCTECKNGTRGCVSCKQELIQKMLEFLKPIQEKQRYYHEHPDDVYKILEEGTKVAKEKAAQTMKEVRQNMKINY